MKLLVLDLETLGFNPFDPIVEIGGVFLDTKTLEISDAFHKLIKEKDKKIKPDAWIFQHSTLKIEDVQEKGIDIEECRAELQDLLKKYRATAFNLKFDFIFLRARKFEIPNPAADPMLVATNILKLPNPGRGGYKWPSVQECLDHFFINDKEPHRALEDVRQEAKIIGELIKLNKYPVEEVPQSGLL